MCGQRLLQQRQLQGLRSITCAAHVGVPPCRPAHHLSACTPQHARLPQPLAANNSPRLQLKPHHRLAVNVRAMASASGSKPVQLEAVDIHNPDELNFIFGHAHFIKTVEDIYEALIQSAPGIKFGVAFCEASPGYDDMPGRRVRFDGNDDALIELAKSNAMAIGAGHSFIIFLGEGVFPVNVLNAVKAVPEVCRIHCATANPTSVILAKTSDDAKGVLGVIDGVVPTAYEDDNDKKKRHEFLRMIGYKR